MALRAAAPLANSHTWDVVGVMNTQELDGLSIQLRVVRILMRVDSVVAAELAASIPLPSLRTPSCTDPLLEVPSGYYETVLRLGRFREVLGRAPATAPVISGLVVALGDGSFAADELKYGVEAVARLLGGVPPNNPWFSSVLTEDRLTTTVSRLLGKLDVPLQNKLLQSYRAFLIRELTAPHCSVSV
jgi:hypothetical protein